MLMGAFKAAMDVYILYTFGGLLSGTLQLMWLSCAQQASISTQVNSSTSTVGSMLVFRNHSLEVTLLCRAGCMLGFATHF